MSRCASPGRTGRVDPSVGGREPPPSSGRCPPPESKGAMSRVCTDRTLREREAAPGSKGGSFGAREEAPAAREEVSGRSGGLRSGQGRQWATLGRSPDHVDRRGGAVGGREERPGLALAPPAAQRRRGPALPPVARRPPAGPRPREDGLRRDVGQGALPRPSPRGPDHGGVAGVARRPARRQRLELRGPLGPAPRARGRGRGGEAGTARRPQRWQKRLGGETEPSTMSCSCTRPTSGTCSSCSAPRTR